MAETGVASKRFTGKDGKNYLLRALSVDDVNKGYFELLGQLSQAPRMDQETFKRRFMDMEKEGCYRLAVIEDLSTGTIASAAGFFIEKKFLRGGSKVAHIEDVVSDNKYRGQGHASHLMSELQRCAWANGCYKVILDCSDKNVPFYEKNKFVKKENSMRYDCPPLPAKL